MVHYERVDNELARTVETINNALRCDEDSQKDKEALKTALSYVNRAREICRMAQELSIRENIFGENVHQSQMM